MLLTSQHFASFVQMRSPIGDKVTDRLSKGETHSDHVVLFAVYHRNNADMCQSFILIKYNHLSVLIIYPISKEKSVDF